MTSYSWIVMGFDHREHATAAAAQMALAQSRGRYPSRAMKFRIIKFADGPSPSFAVTSFAYRLFVDREEAERACAACQAARPNKIYRVRRIEC